MNIFLSIKKHFNYDKLDKQEYKRLVRDIIMLNIIIFHLLWMVFNSLFETEIVRDTLFYLIPYPAFLYQDYIFDNFYIIEIGFMCFYLMEFLFSWREAYRLKTYAKWYFYPFIHFYDLIGSFPGMHFFRLLRIFAMLFRWHSNEIINLENLGIYRTILHIKEIVVEEISDAVVINVLEGVKDEVNTGEYGNNKFLNDVVKPYHDSISHLVSSKVMNVVRKVHIEREEDLKGYVDVLIEDAVKENQEINDIKLIPVVGNYAAGRLEGAISDIVNNVVNDILKDISSEKNEEVLKDVVYQVIEGALFSKDKNEDSQLVAELTNKVLEEVIERVAVKQWQVREQMWEKQKQDELAEKRKLREKGLHKKSD
ncbi:hypothetical protein [Flammeovirga pacifica]|uniref:Preprotein translocase subunit SecA n=1 Tax=Flammeovirga pacifica TaxID=915059 RepID=A0A1S1Z1W3_FLAPC|nr:hypothetical protein [Flammeovirga pacifica]OHX67095.1 hypothetical protein NH26_12450 [Flammeovirga pacifica]